MDSIWAYAICTLISWAIGVVSGLRTQWRPMSIAGLVIAAIGALPPAILLFCIASDEFGPWFSLYPIFLVGLGIGILTVLGMLVKMLLERGGRQPETVPHQGTNSALLTQQFSLLVQSGLLFWMLSGWVPNV